MKKHGLSYRKQYTIYGEKNNNKKKTMSWQGDDDGTSDPLPVDTLVKSLRDVLNDVQDICTGICLLLKMLSVL